MSTTNQKGDIGEAAFVLAATERGYLVGKMPQDCPYDFVMERGNGPERIQVKYRSVNKHGTVEVSSSSKSLSSIRTYNNAVDHFAVYVVETKMVYLIPADTVNEKKTSCYRVMPPKNGQIKNITAINNFIEW